MTCGGFSEVRDATPEEQQILDGVKESAEEQLGTSFQEWTLHSFSTQVVAGVIYMMRVAVDDGEVVHCSFVSVSFLFCKWLALTLSFSFSPPSPSLSFFVFIIWLFCFCFDLFMCCFFYQNLFSCCSFVIPPEITVFL